MVIKQYAGKKLQLYYLIRCWKSIGQWQTQYVSVAFDYDGVAANWSTVFSLSTTARAQEFSQCIPNVVLFSQIYVTLKGKLRPWKKEVFRELLV